MGINCSIFLYRNSFGASQRLALTWKSFRIAQVSHSAGLAVGECSAVMALTPCMLCVQILLCVACIGLLSAEFSTVNTGLGRPMFGNLSVC